MEQGTHKLKRYILLEFIVFIILLAVLWFVILYFGLNLRLEEVKDTVIKYLPLAIGVILILVITKIVLGVLRPAFEKSLGGRTKSHAEVMMIWNLFSNFVWIFVIILLISIFIGDFTGLLAFGVVMAALLYVLQRPILNVAGWLDIIFHRPYAIGDRIKVEGTKGYIVDIGMFHTTLREFGEWMSGDTYTGRLITLQNSCIFETPIINYSRDTPYIWDEIKVAITYESDYEIAKQYILKSAVEVPGENMKKYSKNMVQKIDIRDLKSQLKEDPLIRSEFSDSCMNFFVIYLCKASERREVATEITEKILSRIQKDDKVHIAYPHMEVVGVQKR
jgi:small-conductance mechanosensitive channel